MARAGSIGWFDNMMYNDNIVDDIIIYIAVLDNVVYLRVKMTRGVNAD